MMKQNYLKGTASFMIALILTLPIYSSFALAVLSNGYVYGETNKIRGYGRKNENIILNVTAWISGDSSIIPSQIHISDLRGPIFTQCNEKQGGSFYCTHKLDSSSLKSSPYQIRIALYNDKDIFDSLFILNGAFDELAPEISSFTISPPIINGGDINIYYNVYDLAYSPAGTDKCSGIKKLELSHKNKVFHTADINSMPDDCSASGIITLSSNKINATQGTVEVVLTAYDNLNQYSYATTQFEYDTAAPSIRGGSLEVKDINGNSIDVIKDAPINGVISFIVESNDLNTDNVYGDLSKINIDNAQDYKNKKASCIAYEEGYKCGFANIQVKLSQPTAGPIPITIKAYDKAGNMEPYVSTKVINYDNTGPSVTSIKTGKEDNGISYAGTKAAFIVKLTEEGVGIEKKDIKLDLSSIKNGLNNKAADECTNSGSDWACYWYNIAPDQADGEKTVTISGSDKLGNQLTGTLSATITIDKTPPKIVSSAVNAVGIGVEAIPGYVKTGDSLDVSLKVKEKNKLRAYADLSPFITMQDNETLSCTQENEEDWTCELSSSQIDVPGHRMGNINLNLVDIASNSIQYKKPVEVFEYEGAVNVSYWTSKVKCSPSLVDRQVTDLVNTRIYCSIELLPVTPDQETLSINLGSCTDNYNNSLGYIEGISLINAEMGSTEPYLSIDLIKGEMTIDKLSFTCSLKIISRVGTKINKEPEIEPVKININFYNMPLGEYGQGIEAKIQDAKDDAFGSIWKVIGFLKKIVSYAKLVCNVLHMIYKIKLIYQAITTDLTLAHIASIGTPLQEVLGPAKTAACESDNMAGKYAKASYGFSEEPGALDKFCKFINCQMSPKAPGSDEGGGGKGTWSKIADSLGRGEWLKTATGIDVDKATTSQDWNTLFTNRLFGGKGATGTFEEVFGKQYYQYANARDNLLVAIVTGCLPGVINGLEKYRQIQCLYADCLQQNAYNNVPVKICEDQKAYATCKYVAGEIFAVIPWTAFFDYYMGMIRSALADPLSAIGFGISFWCEPVCEPSLEGSKRWTYTSGCHAVAFLSVAGEIINEVNGIINDYKQIKADYCERIKEDDKD